MSDQVKIVSIGTVGVVTILSFILLPADGTIHNYLVLGLLSLVGVYVPVVSDGIRFVGQKLAKLFGK